MEVSNRKNVTSNSADLENLKQVQQQLLLILHAHKCQRAECKYNHCKTASDIITHMKTCTCRDIVCTFSHCRSSRRLVNHWRHCTPTRQCQLCLPLHQVSISTNDYTSLFEIFQQSATLAVGTTTSRDVKEVARPSTSRGDPQQRKQKSGNHKNPTTSSDDKVVARPSTSRGDLQQRKQKSGNPKNPTTSSDSVKEDNRGIVGNKRGIDFHYNTVMLLCLEGYLHKLSNPNYDYIVHQEDAKAGKFDDIVYQYKDNNDKEWKSLLIQCKNKKTSENRIKTSNLLSDHKKETFSLTTFINSSQKIENIENCHFIIYTNSSFELVENGYLKQWYNKGKTVSLLPSKVYYFPIFGKGSQYKFDNEINIPIFCDNHKNIDKEDWKKFLNKLVFVIVDQPNLEDSKHIIEEKIEYILPKCTEKIWNKLYEMVNRSLYNQTKITAQEISQLIETVKKEIQVFHNNKYVECKLKFVRDIPIYEFFKSGFTTLPIVSTNHELTLYKVCQQIKKLRQDNLAQELNLNKYILEHVYSIIEVKDIRKAASYNLLIITIKNNDQLDMFEMLKNDDQKYITIISNDINVSGIQICYRDVDHSFNLLTDKSKQDVLDEPCVSLNGQIFSFNDILQVNSNSLTQQQVEWLNSVITEDILICYFNEEYKTLKLNFNCENINKVDVCIKRRLRCTEDSNKYRFKKLYKISNDTITEDKLCGVDVNTVLVSDKPGMGKSTLVSSVCNELQKKPRAQIIIRLNFNDHTNSFSKKDLTFNTFEKTVDFIKNELLAKAKLSKLSQNVLNYTLQSKNTIFLFLDGFDEICPDYNDIVVKFIQSLMKYTKCKLFVTTRPGQTNTLERVLSTFALSIQPFTEQDKLLYLDKILESKNIDTKTLLKKINKNSKLTELLGVPLLLKIVAETLKNEKDDNLNINELFNLSLLFRKFIEQKFEIYSTEKKNQDNTIVPSQKDDKIIQKFYEEKHEKLALKLLFSEETETYTEIDYEQIIKIGLVTLVNDQSIIFVHRTFAEYFVATYIQKHFIEDRTIKLLLEDVLVVNDLITLKQFINNYIRDKLNDEETINKYKQYIDNNYITIEENNHVLSILDTAVRENNSEIATFILECFKHNQIMLDSMMSYGWYTALHTAIDRGNIEIATQIINCCDKNNMNEECKAYKFTFGEGSGGGATALYWAARAGYTEVVKLLLAKGTSVNITNTRGLTLLHEAARGGDTVTVQQLIDHGADVNIINNTRLTALHLAASWGHTEVVSLLLAKGASVDIADTTHGWTALHWAARAGHTVIVQQLIDRGADVNITDNKDLTALQLAIHRNS